MKTAVILPPTAASFQAVAGLPLIQRTALSALRAGFDRVVALANDEYAGRLRNLFGGNRQTRVVEVVHRIGEVQGVAVAVVPSDSVVTSATLSRLDAVSLNGRPLLVGVDGGGEIALCRPPMLAGLDLGALAAQGAEQVWAALHARGAERVALPGEICVRITDGASVDAAERALCERLRADSARSDGPLAHWIDRRISLRISRWLVRHTRLLPNHITVIGTSVGLLAAALLSVGGYWMGVVGTLLFLCTTIIDGCDGEVARLTFHDSPFGEKFDVITDNIVHVAIFVGLGLGLYHQNPEGPYLLLAAILLGGFACDGAATYFFLVRRPGFADSGGPPRSLKGKVRQKLLHAFEAMMNRDFAYLLVLLAVIGKLHWFFWGTAFGTYLFAFLLVWIYRWRDAA